MWHLRIHIYVFIVPSQTDIIRKFYRETASVTGIRRLTKYNVLKAFIRPQKFSSSASGHRGHKHEKTSLSLNFLVLDIPASFSHSHTTPINRITLLLFLTLSLLILTHHQSYWKHHRKKHLLVYSSEDFLDSAIKTEPDMTKILTDSLTTTITHSIIIYKEKHVIWILSSYTYTCISNLLTVLLEHSLERLAPTDGDVFRLGRVLFVSLSLCSSDLSGDLATCLYLYSSSVSMLLIFVANRHRSLSHSRLQFWTARNHCDERRPFLSC